MHCNFLYLVTFSPHASFFLHFFFCSENESKLFYLSFINFFYSLLWTQDIWQAIKHLDESLVALIIGHTHSDVHYSVSVIVFCFNLHRSTTWIGIWDVWSAQCAERLCANTTAATLKTKKSTANWIISGKIKFVLVLILCCAVIIL